MAYSVARAEARRFLVDGHTSDGLDLRAAIVVRQQSVPNYGKCNIADYPKYSFLIASLICYTNKQFYAYKAIEDNTKVGYLSHKQYKKYCFIYTKKGHDTAKEYLKNSGRMTTMYKLLKRAVDENPRARWLKNLKLTEKGLEELSRVLQQDSAIEFVQVPVQEAYNLRLSQNGIGSGRRFCTHSCMYGDPVGQFYEHFDVKAYVATKQDQRIGRFLVWHTEDNKTYVDRVYCNGGTQDDILKAIDEKWKDAIKYPEMTEQHTVKCLKPIDDFNMELFYPYLDSFMFLINRNGQLVLSNQASIESDYIICQDASGYGDKKFIKCPKCGALFPKSRYGGGRFTKHYMECEREYDSKEQKEVYMALFKAFQCV